MSFTLPTGNAAFKQPDVKDGSYFGRIVQIAILGLQPREDYKTKEKKKPAVMMSIITEVPKLRIDVDGVSKPRWFFKEFTFSGDEKSNIVKMLGTMIKNGDISSILGEAVTIRLGHTATGNVKVVSLGPCPEEVAVAPLENPEVIFDFYTPDAEGFEKLNTLNKKKVINAIDFLGSRLESVLEVTNTDYSKYVNPPF